MSDHNDSLKEPTKEHVDIDDANSNNSSQEMNAIPLNQSMIKADTQTTVKASKKKKKNKKNKNK